MESYPQVDLSQWRQVGEGGNGKTYENPSRPDAILKVNNARLSARGSASLERVKHEFDVSKAVEGLGLSVPQVYEIVRVGDDYATISQRIKGKKSLSRICHDEPERTEEMARVLCQRGKTLFTTPGNNGFFPSRKEQLLWSLDHVDFVGKKDLEAVRSFAGSIPEAFTCVHGDFQPGNLILSGDYYYWIDLDRFAYGDPMFDIGHLFLVCNVYAPMKQVQELFHMTQDQFARFWDAFAKEYVGKDDHSEFDKLSGRFACLDLLLRPVFTKPSFLEKLFFRIQVGKLVKKYY